MQFYSNFQENITFPRKTSFKLSAIFHFIIFASGADSQIFIRNSATLSYEGMFIVRHSMHRWRPLYPVFHIKQNRWRWLDFLLLFRNEIKLIVILFHNISYWAIRNETIHKVCITVPYSHYDLKNINKKTSEIMKLLLFNFVRNQIINYLLRLHDMRNLTVLIL